MSIVNTIRVIAEHPLNRSARLKALLRFVRWQVASRLLHNPVAMPFVDNTSLLMECGMTGATINWYCGLQDLGEMSFVLHALRQDDLLLDVGANVGSYTILASGAVGAQVIAVEPIPSTFLKLQKNIAFNQVIDLVDAQCCGLSSERGKLIFTSGLDTMNRVAIGNEEIPTIEVPVTTIDKLCGGRVPQIIKIDVEGHEGAVLEGGRGILQSSELEALILETNGSGERFGVSDNYLIQYVCSIGFTACHYDAFKRELLPAKKNSGNTIFVRNPLLMQARCKQAPVYSLINGTI